MHNKKNLSERDICTQYITPALQRAGWDFANQVREEVFFTKGRVIVRGKLHTRGERKRADYVLYYAPNLPIAVIEAKENNHTVGDGMQQGLNYAETLGVPFAISSNGDAFLIHDRTPEGEVPFSTVERKGHYHQQFADDDEKSEYFVPVHWLQTIPANQAIQEIGMFGNQNTVCKPTTPKWRSTVERLKGHFAGYDRG